jgi:predicted alpha/beta hydrolase
MSRGLKAMPPYTIKNTLVGESSNAPGLCCLPACLPAASPGPHPLVVLSAGFLLNGSLYRSYAAHLASYGYAVALYDLNEVSQHACGKSMLHCLFVLI